MTKKCVTCNQPYKEQAHPTIAACSFNCMKRYRDKTGIAFKPLDIRMVYNTGKGHSRIKGEGEDGTHLSFSEKYNETE